MDDAKWQLEHDLWDFLEWLDQQGYVLAKWHNEGDCKTCGIRHLVDKLAPYTGGFSERRNLPRKFLGLESWEQSGRTADDMLAEIRSHRARKEMTEKGVTGFGTGPKD